MKNNCCVRIRGLIKSKTHIRFERASTHIRIVEGQAISPQNHDTDNLKEKEEMSRE